MSRSKKNRENKSEREEKEETEYGFHPDVRKAILAVLFLGVSMVMILSAFNQAGPAGEFAFKWLSKFFGWGYYLWPLTLFISAGVLLSSNHARPLPATLIGAAIFITTALGLIDLNFPQQGGLTGVLIGYIKIPFGYNAALILLTTFLAASFIAMTNWPLKISWNGLKKIIFIPKTEQEIIMEETKNYEAPDDDAESEAENKKEKNENAEAETEPKISLLKTKIAAFKTTPKKTSSLTDKNYIAPPPELLKSSSEKPTIGDLRANANIIKRTLESFGIPVEMGEINVGPTVTRYTLKPAEGVKLSRIIALNQDLALALAAHPIRIEAPIPGKSLIGIETPNKSAALVRLGNLMSYPDFQSAGILNFVLGRDVSGAPIFADIAKMPHLLIAGATGSGKSVCIHSLLISLLYKNSPSSLRLILIDPKKVELSVYEGLPHLIAPVVTDGKKTLGVFRWAIQEMEKRYETLLSAGARDIKSYNEKNPANALSYILIVIDELADLMAVYGREIEGSVIRLAQMARATGLHIVVSTQRPSVEVITGLIKANITSRIALQVASNIDSRTILDSAGAEKLLGNGDLLFISSDFSKPKRIQGAYVSEEEVEKVTKFIRENNENFTPEIENNEELNGAPFNNNFENADLFEENAEEDELFNEAVKTVFSAKKASASLLQRRLKVGYARAARLLDIMEDKGFIGPGEGAKPREILMDQNQENNG